MKLEDQTMKYDGYVYPVPSLITASKDFEIIELELAYFYMNDSITPDNSIFEFAIHMKRVMKADLKYPIILKAVKFDEMPNIGFKK